LEEDKYQKMKITFKKEVDKWTAYNKFGDEVGDILFDEDWDTHVWSQIDGVIMSHRCLVQILDKMAKLNKERGVKNSC
jgi:hypothetical protein